MDSNQIVDNQMSVTEPTEEKIIYNVKTPDGSIVKVKAPAGADQAEIIEFVAQNYSKPSKVEDDEKSEDLYALYNDKVADARHKELIEHLKDVTEAIYAPKEPLRDTTGRITGVTTKRKEKKLVSKMN